jgi:hypothetical protein
VRVVGRAGPAGRVVPHDVDGHLSRGRVRPYEVPGWRPSGSQSTLA